MTVRQEFKGGTLAHFRVLLLLNSSGETKEKHEPPFRIVKAAKVALHNRSLEQYFLQKCLCAVEMRDQNILKRLYNIKTEKEMFQASSVGFRDSYPQEATLAIGRKLGTTAVCQWCPSSERPRGYFYLYSRTFQIISEQVCVLCSLCLLRVVNSHTALQSTLANSHNTLYSSVVASRYNTLQSTLANRRTTLYLSIVANSLTAF